MISDIDDFLALVARVYGDRPTPKPFQILRAVQALRAGGDAASLARVAKTTARNLRDLASSDEALARVLKLETSPLSEDVLKRARLGIGQLLLGQLAERVFEDIYRTTMGTNELRLEDARESRSDTDYRVYNGHGHSVFRINIKFHGSQFRGARDLVGLESADCFPLATYKIHAAVLKHEREHLPYLFVVVGVPNLTREVAGHVVPVELVELVAMVSHGRRDVEDVVVSYLTGPSVDPVVADKINGFHSQIENAKWAMMSARRANAIMRANLFERVFALRIKNFAQQYRRAEVDMHFSVEDDLIPLRHFLETLRAMGLNQLMVMVERGTF